MWNYVVEKKGKRGEELPKKLKGERFPDRGSALGAIRELSFPKYYKVKRVPGNNVPSKAIEHKKEVTASSESIDQVVDSKIKLVVAKPACIGCTWNGKKEMGHGHRGANIMCEFCVEFSNFETYTESTFNLTRKFLVEKLTMDSKGKPEKDEQTPTSSESQAHPPNNANPRTGKRSRSKTVKSKPTSSDRS